MTEERLVFLIVGQLSGRLRPEESQELQSWADEDAAHQGLLTRILTEAELEREMEQYRAIDPDAGYERWISFIRSRQKVRRMRMIGWAAAACVLAAISMIGLSRLLSVSKLGAPAVASVALPVMPGRNTATLTLSNGHQILLDSAATGDLAREGGARLVKADSSSLHYQQAGREATPAIVYNVLTTPRSGQYQLTLADGSRVWLNNVSSLRFPTAFVGKDRVVELQGGEAYFEIATDPSKPFIVKIGDETVEVLGTHFNITAYPEEGGTQTTLLSGAVRVRKGQAAVQLKPDQQALTEADGHLRLVDSVAAEDIASWKDGFFYFGRASFAGVMRQLARWYNIEVVYEGKAPEMEFGGKIDRGLTLDQLLKYLDKNQVHFRLDGRKLVVLSK